MQTITNKLVLGMKKILLFFALGCALAGCRSDIDLGNIDAKVSLENTGIALPIGRFRMTLKDMIGDVDKLYIDSGAITWKMDTTISRDYHAVDLAKYISSVNLEMGVYDQVKYLIQPDGKIHTYTEPITLTLNFPIILKLDGINNKDSLHSERIDSAYIDRAGFASTIQAINGLPLDWNWIDKVTLDLGAQMKRNSGSNTMTVYQKGDKYGYGDSIPINVEDFYLTLMEDPTQPASYTNVIDTCKFDVHFTFTIPANMEIEMPQNAAFQYKLDVQFFDYTAIWGMFSPSKAMSDENKINLSDSWDELDFLTKSRMPFANPSIDIDIKTQIAGALKIDSAYLYVTSQEGLPKYAEFGPNRDKYREYIFKAGEYLPLSSPIGTWTDNLKVRFDSTPDGGRIHELFTKIPKELGYRFCVRFNQEETPQIRVTSNTTIKVGAHAELPFVFNQGVFVNYPDTFHDAGINKLSLDSLQASSSTIDTISASQLKMVLQAKNNIPMHVKVAFRCFDKDGKMIMDPEDSTKPFLLFDQDTITLEPPTLAYDGKKKEWIPTAEGKTSIIANLNESEIKLISKIKDVAVKAVLDDESLKYAYDAGMQNIHLLGSQDVTFKIGVSARVSTILDFN